MLSRQLQGPGLVRWIARESKSAKVSGCFVSWQLYSYRYAVEISMAGVNDELVVSIEGVFAGFNSPCADRSNVVCCLSVPNRLLHNWHRASSSYKTSYIQLLNDAIRGNAITVDVHCDRLEQHLHRRAREVAS